MIRRQELLDRIRQEQVPDDHRPRTYSPRRRYTPSPHPPPSRRSLPDLGRSYHFNWHNKDSPPRERQEVDKVDQPRTQVVYVQGDAPSYPRNAQYDLPPLQYQQLIDPAMSQTKHIIEHQFRQADQQKTYVLPPIQAPQMMPQVTTIQAPQPVIQQLPPVHVVSEGKSKDTMFNKSDFMDMMMLQNAQMHHMVMQQMMLQNLPGGGGGGNSFKMPTAQVPMAPFIEPMRIAAPAPMAYAAPAPAPAAPMVHHYGDMRPYGRGYYGGDYSPWYY